MPRLPLKPCTMVGCPERATHKGKCTRHALEQERQRGSSTARGYGQRWRELRAKYLADHPYCVMCGEPAVVVDHIKLRRRGGTNDYHNLQALCKQHHDAKTMRETVGLG